MEEGVVLIAPGSGFASGRPGAAADARSSLKPGVRVAPVELISWSGAPYAVEITFGRNSNTMKEQLLRGRWIVSAAAL